MQVFSELGPFCLQRPLLWRGRLNAGLPQCLGKAQERQAYLQMAFHLRMYCEHLFLSGGGQPPHSSWLHSLPGTAHTPVHKLWLLTHREGDSLLPNRTDILIHILVYIFAGLRSEAPGPKLFFFNLKLLIKILLNCHPKKSCTNLHIHQWRTEVPISPQSHQLWKLFANWVGKKYCFN